MTAHLSETLKFYSSTGIKLFSIVGYNPTRQPHDLAHPVIGYSVVDTRSFFSGANIATPF